MSETPAEPTEAQKIWQDYLNECASVGHLMHQLANLESQQRDVEKRIEVTQERVRKIAVKHDQELKKEGKVPVEPVSHPEVPTVEAEVIQ